MIVVHLKKDIKHQRYFVESWYFVSKQEAAKIEEIPGYRVVVDHTKIPPGFYERPHWYFYEEGQLRNGYGINE